MRINNNVMALNAHRQLGMNQAGASKSMEKLSSGFRINRAGDDAAGLAISEKMRGQIRGLKQATRNAQDGISLIQTAEGALNETHAILQRMRELAVQSSTDTNEPDRDEIQKEINELAEEITRISTDTEFNTQKLLGGKFNERVFHIGANEAQNVKLSIADMSAKALKVAGTDSVAFVEDGALVAAGGDTDLGAAFADGTFKVIEADDYEGTDMVVGNVEGGDLNAVSHVMVDKDGNAVGTSTNGLQFHAYGAAGTGTGAKRADVTFTNEVAEVTVAGSVVTGQVEIERDPKLPSLNTGTYKIVDVSSDVLYGTGGGGWTVGLADDKGNIVALGNTALGKATAANTVVEWVDAKDGKVLLEHAANAGFDTGSEISVTGKGLDVSSQASADKAITTINDALQAVSGERSKLGAMQNRLEHTIANLGTSAENLQAAESRIRDLDMAEEIMAFTKNNILQQAATAMLAQANMAPQSVLQLLG